ncbi:MAG: potassium-transporting ATPase subunit KdpC [Candidatus Firestonebacteria bacterium]|nr:potassium-transporting ATPase subunit KdpC [Candidatus Firestonebacteria bacterium]
MKTITGTALRLFLLLTLLTGLIYPLTMTGLLQTIFPLQAYGSLTTRAGKTVGSALLAQKFSDPKYFWPRPSAADFATTPSGASNWGPISPALRKTVGERRAALQSAQGLPATAAVPADLVFASGSGLDPHISPAAAEFQLWRVARARGLTPVQIPALKALIARNTAAPQFGCLGQARVNVLLLNLELDTLK